MCVISMPNSKCKAREPQKAARGVALSRSWGPRTILSRDCRVWGALGFRAVGLRLYVKSFRMLGLSARVAYSLSDCGQVFVLAESQQAGCKRA